MRQALSLQQLFLFLWTHSCRLKACVMGASPPSFSKYMVHGEGCVTGSQRMMVCLQTRSEHASLEHPVNLILSNSSRFSLMVETAGSGHGFCGRSLN
jgi:hypothetical protein